MLGSRSDKKIEYVVSKVVCSRKKNILERCDVVMWAEFSKGIIRERLITEVPSRREREMNCHLTTGGKNTQSRDNGGEGLR